MLQEDCFLKLTFSVAVAWIPVEMRDISQTVLSDHTLKNDYEKLKIYASHIRL